MNGNVQDCLFAQQISLVALLMQLSESTWIRAICGTTHHQKCLNGYSSMRTHMESQAAGRIIPCRAQCPRQLVNGPRCAPNLTVLMASQMSGTDRRSMVRSG